MNFTYFIGNENLKKRVSSLVDSARLPHAILIEGESGIGKRTLAREMATALVCRSGGERHAMHAVSVSRQLKGCIPIFMNTALRAAPIRFI